MTACADSAPAPVHMGTSAGYDYTPRGNYVPPEGFHPVAPANNGYTQQELPPPSQISPQQPLVPDSSSTMDNTQGYHIVTQDETLYSIARSYKTDVRTLINGNNLAAPYRVEAGQRLISPSQSIPSQKREEPVLADASPQVSSLRSPPPLEKLSPLSVPPARTNGRFGWPVVGRVISAFGEQDGGQRNDGINIDVVEGTPVKAAEAAVVAYAGNQIRGFGNLVLLKHSDGWMTTYAHNRKILVKRGERVEKGQIIAESGATGSVKTPQLHFEVRQSKKAVDPMKYLERHEITQL